ncbi:ankyrin repeat and SAM domain-containing protein 3 isoform X1 [Chaetodon trifascialis]|uniref:ankyrin repeat and SAM domain-containing protein 3 isoform X1 n=2 Tax=Chaetodon trifascialis TaxID=109706 RepID=UPI0039915D9B
MQRFLVLNSPSLTSVLSLRAAFVPRPVEGRLQKMSELSDEASESEQLGASLSLWLGDTLVRPEELDVPLDLHTACSIGQYDVVAECIKKREVDLDGKNMGGWTPLMYASYIGHDNIANLLLEAGVDVNAATAKGLTPLMLAASCGNESIAYFLLQQGAELELKDSRGWTALFHCTSTGHQQMVKFLLDNNADTNVKEPGSGFTPLMEAAASGHEIIVQNLLDHKVKVDDRNAKGETARALAMMYGYTKIVSLIDSRSPRIKPGHYEDLSSSEDSDSAPPRIRLIRNRAKGISIHDGPQAIAKFRVGGTSKLCEPPAVPPGYMTFRDTGEQSESICYRDVTSPINELDGQSNSSRDDSPFFDNDMPTMRSSSSSSEGLPQVIGLNWEGSVESNEDSDQCKKSSSRRVNKGHHSKGKSRHGSNDAAHSSGTVNCGMRSHVGLPPSYTGPKDLAEFLEQIGFSKYLPLLEEQDIDLRIFLTLTENDLKEIGITLFGPKRKMTSAIARWHSSARPPSDALEQAYADQLEAEMQEMAIQLHKRCEEVESLQSQVSQEKELRTVMEGCLMEDKMAWRRVHAELVENHRMAQEMSSTLAESRAHCTELLSCFSTDGNSSSHTGVEDKTEGDAGVKAGEGLTCSSVVELIKKMDSHEEQLAGILQTMLQSLRRLSAPEKVSDSWERP